MEKNYKTLITLLIAFLLISLSGFYNSYFQYFPKFENITFFTHIHFIIFISWFAILISQPLLIKQKKFSLHRKIGRLSYFLAPIMVVSILIMIKLSVAKNLSISNQQAVIAGTGAILDSAFFSTFYILSMIYRKIIRRHVAFLIGASLIILNPGLGRLITDLTNQGFAILAMILTPYLVSLTVLFYEKLKLKRPLFRSPYLVVIGLWTLEITLFITLPNTVFWQNLIQNIAKM